MGHCVIMVGWFVITCNQGFLFWRNTFPRIYNNAFVTPRVVSLELLLSWWDQPCWTGVTNKWSERLKVYSFKEQIDTVLNKESAVRLTHLQLQCQGLTPHCFFFSPCGKTTPKRWALSKNNNKKTPSPNKVKKTHNNYLGLQAFIDIEYTKIILYFK